MNELIFTVFCIAALLNALSFLVGIGEWLWYSVIMQEKSPGFFWKWQNFKYQQWCSLDGRRDAFTILLDIMILLGGFFIFGMLGAMGVLAPLAIIVAAVLGARWYVADKKAKS